MANLGQNKDASSHLQALLGAEHDYLPLFVNVNCFNYANLKY
ncbi:hypothetical protein GLIP_1606 [Aliiglaciecola lipolytica E3]|uniref:Uncharacterized protein n=1 Tax=Aliiglaciecola lipolytica E3 TaxID=1127673 RepID=K6YSG6_9ALTE|nr:hypothetical protein GLIP_1606 [Aliiglaciecola lipolytica E3]